MESPHRSTGCRSLPTPGASTRLSTGNQLSGTVTAVTPGSEMATVEVDVGAQEMTASITQEAVEDLGLSVGSPVVVLVRSTEVVLAVED